MEVTLGGDRLGSGNKQKQEMHNYNRASFNQEQDWKSPMAPGILYPFLCIPMTNGDSMDIDLDALVMTLPTKGPMMGSFKLQADIFSIPMRLYNGVLHNNPLDIGLKMNQIYLPKLGLTFDPAANRVIGSNDYTWQINNTSLLKYLGLSGIGTKWESSETDTITRKINAIPVLGYYDIFKQYYANKQEENAYIIGPGEPQEELVVIYASQGANNYPDYEEAYRGPEYDPYEGQKFTVPNATDDNWHFIWELKVKKPKDWDDSIRNLVDSIMFKYDDSHYTTLDVNEIFSTVIDEEPLPGTNDTYWVTVRVNNDARSTFVTDMGGAARQFTIETPDIQSGYTTADIELKTFPLKNIDRMRECILSKAQLGHEFVIPGDWDETDGEDHTGLPYSQLFEPAADSESTGIVNPNSFAQNGLVVKTYQSDIYNNWIETDWIEGENGIAALSAVNVEGGTLEMDALNLAQKVYNMLNRVAISGGTYEDWQEAVFTQEAVRKAESPIYEGGMAGEITFQQVISSSETDVDGDKMPLGSIGGKGSLIGTRGGKNIHIKAREPIFVMGIVSITPRICYTQGNEWYLTELNSFDDLHKPALDGIGFQDLIAEQMLWTDTVIDNNTVKSRRSAGKVVAWSNYMTAVDKAYGDFAEPMGKGFMVLSRNYVIGEGGQIADLTTYIDPSKFNYAFAYTDLAANNFWVQMHSKVVTRRVMSAHQIPNL